MSDRQLMVDLGPISCLVLAISARAYVDAVKRSIPIMEPYEHYLLLYQQIKIEPQALHTLDSMRYCAPCLAKAQPSTMNTKALLATLSGCRSIERTKSLTIS